MKISSSGIPARQTGERTEGEIYGHSLMKSAVVERKSAKLICTQNYHITGRKCIAAAFHKAFAVTVKQSCNCEIVSVILFYPGIVLSVRLKGV